MQFQKEQLSPELFAEMLPLLTAHYKEIAHYQDIPLEPDYSSYKHLSDSDCLRIFTARNDDKELIGYCVYFVRENLHYKSSLQAVQDIVYVRPDCRGVGARLIKWSDEQLKADKVQVVYQHVKSAHNFGPMLERMGYELVDLIYARRLDGING
jgi:GNAT superfamily N-acetyltransferase